MVRRFEADPVDRDERLGEAIETYLELVESGAAPAPEQFAARYPDLRDDLCAALEGLALVQGLVGSPAGPSQQLEAGRRIAGYRIVRELGRGGMGVVYDAVHVDLDRPVALKVLGTHATPDSTGRRRFLNEARTAAGLHHTHIVPVFDVGQVGGLCYYAMQRIEGCGLDRVLRALRRDRTQGSGGSGSGRPGWSWRTPIPTLSGTAAKLDETGTWLSGTGLGGDGAAVGAGTVARRDDEPPPFEPPRGAAYYRWVAEVGRQAAEALAYAHRRGVVHRDVKPSNFLVDGRGTVWVADFGLARRLADPGLTRSDSLLGTPRYMSPEQARTGPIDGRTDVYSLGATLYELLTLRPPFDGRTAAELVRQIQDCEPPAPRSFDPRIPRDLETIVLKTMAKRPADRYASAAELAEDLGRFLRHEPVKARRISPIGRLWRIARRHPRTTAALTAAASVVLAVATFAYVRVVHERDRAIQAQRDQLLSAAQVVRHSTMPNHRERGLALLKEAAALKPEPVQTVQLRDEAVEFLVSRDIQPGPEIATGSIQALALVAEGHRLATVSETEPGGAEFVLWDVARDERLATHRLEAGPAPDPDRSARGFPGPRRGHDTMAVVGSHIAVVSPDGRGLHLFDAMTGDPVETWPMPDRRLVAVLGAAHGQSLVTIERVFRDRDSSRGTVAADSGPGMLSQRVARDFDPQPLRSGGQVRLTSSGDTPPVLAWDEPDEDRDDQFRIVLWDVARPERPQATLHLPRSSGSSGPWAVPLIAIDPEGKTVATARMNESTILLWDTETGHQRGVVDAESPLTALALGPDGLLAAAVRGGDVHRWDLEAQQRPLPVLSTHQSFINLVRFSPRGGLLAVAGPSAGVELWDLATARFVTALTMPESIGDLSFAPSSERRLAAGGGRADTVAVWDIVDPIGRVRLAELDNRLTTLAFGPDRQLAIGSWNEPLQFWRPNRCPSKLMAWTQVRPSALAFDPQGRLLVQDAEGLSWFQLPTRLPSAQVELPPPKNLQIRGFWAQRRNRGFLISAQAVASANNGQTLALTRLDEVWLWQARDPQHLRPVALPEPYDDGNAETGRPPVPWENVALSPDGRQLYLNNYRNEFLACTLERGDGGDGLRAQQLDWDLPEEVTTFALSPDGLWLALGDRSGRVVLINTKRGSRGTELTPLAGKDGAEITALAFSPDGRELAVGTREQVRLWTLDGGRAQPLVRLPGHRGFIIRLTYDPKGQLLATGGDDQTVEVWDLHRVRNELTKLGLGW